MIEKIESLSENWHQPWTNTNTSGFPQNLSGRKYNGVNAMLLYMLCEKYSYKMPVFMTFNQASEMKVMIRKGEKSFPVIFYSMNVRHKDTNKSITYDEYRNLSKEDRSNYDTYPILVYHNVFNIDQTNLREVKPDLYSQLESKFKVETVVKEGQYVYPPIDEMINKKGWLCNINVKSSNSAFYSPVHDSITVPLKVQFESGESFYGTLLHEMTHSTAIESRLNRETGHVFGDSKYAKEELVAELTSAMLCQSMGITKTIQEENAAYLKSWLGELRKSPSYLMNILFDVKKASSMISDEVMKFDNTIEQKNDVELERAQDNIKTDKKEDSNLEREPFDWQKQSQEYNEKHNLNFNGNINNTSELDTFFNTMYQPKEGQNIGILGEKYLYLLQEKNKSEQRPAGQFLIDPDLIRDVLDCMGYDRTNVLEYKRYGNQLCDQIFDYAVKEVSTQKDKSILFLTGSPASGKGHALKDEKISADINLNGHSIIYDNPMSDFGWGSNCIRDLLNKEFKVDYVQVYNDFHTSYKNMIDRGLKEGRFVDCDFFIKSFERQTNRPFDILDMFYKELNGDKFKYKGIDCSENIIKEQIYDLRTSNGMFVYKIDCDELNKCYDYGTQILQGLERRDRNERLDKARDPAFRDIAKDKLAAQLRGLSMVMQEWLHDKQLQNVAGTIEKPVERIGRQGMREIGNDTLGLSIEFSSDDKKFIQLLQDKNWSEIVMLKEGGYKPSKDVMSAFNTNALSKTERLILDVVLGSNENTRGAEHKSLEKDNITLVSLKII